MPTAVKKLYPSCPEDPFAGKLLSENLSFYITFRTLSEIFVFRPKLPTGLAKLHSTCPELFSRKSRFFVRLFSCKPFSDCRRKTFGRMKKIYLTGVSNRQSTCPDDPSNEKNFFCRNHCIFFRASTKNFLKRPTKFCRRDCQTTFHVPKGSIF